MGNFATRVTARQERGSAVPAPTSPFPEARLAERPWFRDSLRRRLLALADGLAALAGSFALAIGGAGVDAGFWSALFVPVWILLAKIHGLYDRDHRALRHLTADELPRIAVWSLSGSAAVTGLLALTPAGVPAFGPALTTFVAAGTAAVALRAAARFAWRWITPPEHVLIVGTGSLADETRRKLELFADIHAVAAGQRDDLTREDLLHGRLEGVDRIVLASPAIDEDLIARLVRFCRETYTKLSVIPPARGLFGTAVQLEHVADLPVIAYNTWDVSRSTLLLKRTLDVVVSLLALVVLSPVFVLAALIVLVDSGRPVFFRQLRAGRDGRPFTILKFRTMVADAEDRLASLISLDALPAPMFKLVEDPRVTRFGRFLRRTSLDELPQLWNVLTGDMSLVGPRPEQLELVARYAPEHRFRLAVRPGMTGPMQVYGRGQLRFEERLAVERDYIENLSLGRDLRLLALTLTPLVSGRGAC